MRALALGSGDAVAIDCRGRLRSLACCLDVDSRATPTWLASPAPPEASAESPCQWLQCLSGIAEWQPLDLPCTATVECFPAPYVSCANRRHMHWPGANAVRPASWSALSERSHACRPRRSTRREVADTIQVQRIHVGQPSTRASIGWTIIPNPESVSESSTTISFQRRVVWRVHASGAPECTHGLRLSFLHARPRSHTTQNIENSHCRRHLRALRPAWSRSPACGRSPGGAPQ